VVFSGTADALATGGIEVDVEKWRTVIFSIRAGS